ncbi:hypothetical protein Pst134EA_032587 [Puccinia striiformis f. sp. tritici]|uniref:uncharacterized protein n=1 Tax=Puccinia striiformis f. sp. tritici TaxID=168172 RepID=UPI002007A660|nr:uncharacterized protein Pst134EA_032587 [Puccinia striiformis f. sp. tritici]KAH9443576.1 hypothetical protein Pst134EA_032587 [Puccinia striiformis f. sp. tritici]
MRARSDSEAGWGPALARRTPLITLPLPIPIPRPHTHTPSLIHGPRGRITHYAVDLALISTVLAGVKRNTGYSVKVQELPEGVPQTVATSYLKNRRKNIRLCLSILSNHDILPSGSNRRQWEAIMAMGRKTTTVITKREATRC